MHALLFVFEFLGTTELLVIAVVALILFGPRKLPEIGRSVGKSIAEFKRASDDFKRTWEFEVELEQRKSTTETEAGAVVPPPAAAAELGEGNAHFDAGDSHHDAAGETVARTPSSLETEKAAVGAEVTHADGVQTSPAHGDENKAS